MEYGGGGGFGSAGQQLHFGFVPDKVPITFVDKVSCGKILGNGVRLKLQIQRTVSKCRSAAFPSEADPLREFFAVCVAVYREVNVSQPAAAIQKRVQFVGASH